MDDQKDQNTNHSKNKTPKNYKKCAVVNCKDCEGKTVHSFPVSSIEREKVYITNLLKKWIDFCKNPSLTLENYKYQSSFIGLGETHFSMDCYPFQGPKKRLKKGSIPTLKPPLAVPSQVHEEPIDKNFLYGNMGCRVFKRGVQLEIFLPKNRRHTQKEMIEF